MKRNYLKLLINISLILSTATSQDLPFISNYDERCMRCICEASTGCNQTVGCEKGYCGPFKISRVFWIEAGNITLPQDDPERMGAYEDCSLLYYCAKDIILGYYYRYGRDCNDDGVTNCNDYAMMHFNGRNMCHPPIDRTEFGKKWLERYNECDPLRENTPE